jgi:hypothetical protein
VVLGLLLRQQTRPVVPDAPERVYPAWAGPLGTPTDDDRKAHKKGTAA